MMSQAAPARSVAWRQAWGSANSAFYSRKRAEEEFTTSIHAGTSVAAYLAEMIRRNSFGDEDFFVIDVGSGDGELLRQLAPLVGDVHLIGIDMRSRPADLPASISWVEKSIDDGTTEITGYDGSISGLLVAHEFLDDVPCEIVELDDDLNPRFVLVDQLTGHEEIGPRLDDVAASRIWGASEVEAMQMWLDRWWPSTRPLARREIGLQRDRTWARLTRVLDTGLAVAIDYAHARPERASGLWDAGTVKGFSAGRPCTAIPNGRVNITAHVALDACSSEGGKIVSQAEVLGNTSLESWPAGLGSYSWLIQPIMKR